jgi:hypothetical protein
MVLLKGGYVAQSLGGAESMGFLLNEIWGLLAAALLVWAAWRSPKVE